MRLSKIFTKTSKESTADASSVNANLLVRGAFISKTMSGVYSFLPLGMKVLSKLENILREEMDKIGSEVFLPALSPKKNWEQTGRLNSVSVLFEARGANQSSRKTNDTSYVLNSTHEEVVTPLVQQFVQSYRDLPTACYQIQTKFRNEARPKSGILRGREFRMKDLYSFHDSKECMMDFFLNKAIPTYQSYFNRIGLGNKTVVALASGGDFSTEPSREFQTLIENGEDLLFYDDSSETWYNREIAPCLAKVWDNSTEQEQKRVDVLGEGIVGVEELARFLKIEVERTTKTLLYSVDNERLVAVAVRGEYEVNEEKLKNVLNCKTLSLASAEEVEKVTSAKVGYAGPINLPENVQIIWDESCKNRKNFECGANKTNEHSINVNFGRDLPKPEEFYDVKTAREGDLNPKTSVTYKTAKGSEAGNVFTLFTKFSEAFDFKYIDQNGKAKPVYMGCYGIGTSRIMGILAEIFHDEKGLKWPANIAPAKFYIVPIGKPSEQSLEEAEKIYASLSEKNIDAIIDDREDASIGFKLKDSELIGCPYRIVVSKKTLKENSVEFTERATGETKLVKLKDLDQILYS